MSNPVREAIRTTRMRKMNQTSVFYQSGQGGFWRRTGYAISRIFVTRTDSGNETFNSSEIFGAAIELEFRPIPIIPTPIRRWEHSERVGDVDWL
jgi:hypothetical protein